MLYLSAGAASDSVIPSFPRRTPPGQGKQPYLLTNWDRTALGSQIMFKSGHPAALSQRLPPGPPAQRGASDNAATAPARNGRWLSSNSQSVKQDIFTAARPSWKCIPSTHTHPQQNIRQKRRRKRGRLMASSSQMEQAWNKADTITMGVLPASPRLTKSIPPWGFAQRVSSAWNAVLICPSWSRSEGRCKLSLAGTSCGFACIPRAMGSVFTALSATLNSVPSP